MEFTFTFWSWLGLIGNLATIAISLAILLVMVGIVRPGPRGGPEVGWHRANFWFALFLASLFGQVASGQFTNFLFWLKHGEPLVSFWVSLSFFSANGVLLFAFVGNLIGLHRRAFQVALSVGALGWLVAIFLIFRGMVATEVRLNESGLLRYSITPLGYGLSALPFVYQFAALGLLFHHRQRVKNNWIILGVGALIIGPVLSLLQVERFIGVAIPYTALGPAIGISTIGYIIARRQIFNPLRQLTFELEHQVAERTRELEQAGEDMRLAYEALNQRARQLQTTINITHEIASSLDLDQMLHRAVELIHNRLGYFHVAIYLVDERGEWAVLGATAGEAAHPLKKIGRRLRVEADTPVGYVAARGEPRLTFSIAALESIEIAERLQSDAEDSPVSHSLLPGARSGLTLPLKVGTQVIGALDLQSGEDTFLEEEDITVLQTLADQVAVAIENARLFRRTEAQLDELTALYRRYSQQVWGELPTSLAVTYRQGQLQAGGSVKGIGRSGDQESENLEVGSPDSLEGEENLLTIPVKLHDETIGVLGFRKDDASEEWSASEKVLAESVVSQMALALENARLYQEAQRLAQRERTLNQMTARFASSIDIDTVLQTAARELGQLPHVAEVSVHVGPPESLPPANGGEEVDYA